MSPYYFMKGNEYNLPFFYSVILPVHFTRVGFPFEIVLTSNPSTGYQWEIINLPNFIRLISENYIPDHHPPGWVGGGGRQVFTFVADYPGDDVLSFDYTRPLGESADYYAIRVIAVD